MRTMTLEPPTQTITPLCDRNLYRHCHIQVADLEGRLPALAQAQKYYYFFKYFEDLDNAQVVATKLQTKGDDVIITQIPLGFAVWVFEPEAVMVPKRDFQLQDAAQSKPEDAAATETAKATMAQTHSKPDTSVTNDVVSATEPEPHSVAHSGVGLSQAQGGGTGQELCFPILQPADYSYHQIQVPDLDEHLAAIAVNGVYYSFFRATGEIEELISITNKLAKRGDDVKITSESNRYTIWVFEPDATAIGN